MKKDMYLSMSGVLIYIIATVIDRFITDIADYVYIPIMIVALLLMVIGIIIRRVGK